MVEPVNPFQGGEFNRFFAQGFDKDLGEFDRQLERYQALLSPAGSNGRGHETPVAVNEAADVAKTKTVVSKN